LEKGCKIGDDIWAPYDLDYKDPTMADFSEYIIPYDTQSHFLPGSKPFGYAIVEGHTLYTYEAIKYLRENQNTLFPGWHLATLSELENLADYAHSVERSGGDWYEALDTKGPKGFNFSDAYSYMEITSMPPNHWWWERGGFGAMTIGGDYGIWNIKTSYGLDDLIWEYSDFISDERGCLFTLRLVKDK
jgi:hypothetical protein